jgi:hypothetical protein
MSNANIAERPAMNALKVLAIKDCGIACTLLVVTPFQGWWLSWSVTQGGASRLRRYAVPWAIM